MPPQLDSENNTAPVAGDVGHERPLQPQEGASSLTEAQRQAVFQVFSGFYKDISGKWQTTVLVDIWQGPDAVMVHQVNADPMAPTVAKSLIAMLHTITQAKPEPNETLLRNSGALEALFGIAFGRGPRLDQLPYESLPLTTLSPDEGALWKRCCITLKELTNLEEPMVIRSGETVHLFDFPALKQSWREGFRFINPMSRKLVDPATLMRIERPQSKAP